ncbi:CCA tRNA nucleotidyltransferase, partial [bacterium]|nr:CCA tRNA nucleotidyltransferase [bacterium]
TEFIFKRSLGSYLKFVDIKPYIEKTIKDKVLSSKISLWDYYDNYVKDLRFQIKFRKYILSYRIFKEILPRVFFKPVLIPPKDRKKHPILLSFKKYFSKYFSVSIIDLFQQIKQIGDKDHLNIFLVGGIPRDLLIAHLNSKNKITIDELDFVVSGGSAIHFAEKINRKLKGRLSFYKDFNTATIKLPNISLDFATARSEVYLEQGRLPMVEHTDLYNDLKRRDFTINAIAISLNSKDFGKIIDYFGGQLDIRKGYLRILHQKSFFDDPTRVLRMIRFKNSLNFNIEPRTEKLLGFSLDFGIFQSIKGVRLTRELSLLFQLAPSKGVEGLIKYNLLYEFFGVEDLNIQKLKLLNSSINWLSILHPEINIKKDLITFGYIFKTGKNINRDLFVFKKKEDQIIREIITIKIPKFLSISSKFSSFYKYFGKLSIEAKLFILVEMNEKLRKYYIEFLLKTIALKPIITGGEIMKLGFQGEIIGKIMEKIIKLQLDGKIIHKEDAIDYIKRRFIGI